MELFGPSSWLEGFYLAALKAGEEMARYLGEEDSADEYRELFERGKAWSEEHLFNGRYYIQQIDLKDASILETFEGAKEYWNKDCLLYTSRCVYETGSFVNRCTFR